MSNTRPALLFQKDNPNLCKNDVNAGQFPGKRHLHEPENSAEVPGCRTPQRNTAPLAAGASRRVATASALSPRAAAAHPAAEQDLRTPERRPPSEEPTSKRRCCLLSPAADPQGAARTPPPFQQGFLWGCARAERPPRPAASTWCCLPGLATIRPVLRGWPGLAALAAPLGSAPAPPGRCQPGPARPAQGRSGGRGAAPPGIGARRDPAAAPCAREWHRAGAQEAAAPGQSTPARQVSPRPVQPRPPRLRSALLPGPETLLGRCFPPPSPVPDARVSTFKKQNNYAFYTEKSQEVHILQIFVWLSALLLLQKSGLLPIPKIITVLGKHMFCNRISKTLSLCLQQAVLRLPTPPGL